MTRMVLAFDDIMSHDRVMVLAIDDIMSHDRVIDAVPWDKHTIPFREVAFSGDQEVSDAVPNIVWLGPTLNSEPFGAFAIGAHNLLSRHVCRYLRRRGE